jgi:multidrug efflux pump subunit AcrA (membrane-fusion protein)
MITADQSKMSAPYRPWKLLIGGCLALLAIAAFLAGYLARKKTTRQLDAAAELRQTSPPLVNVAKVKRAPSRSEVLLPGNITPITEAYVYARAAGYLKRRYVDIGDRVREGQLLAEIDAPDLDQQVTQGQAAVAQSEGQLGQAEATLQQLIATRDLANLTWKRYGCSPPAAPCRVRTAICRRRRPKQPKRMSPPVKKMSGRRRSSFAPAKRHCKD